MLPIYFIKAVQKKTITVPGYARRNGTYVPPHQKTVMFDPDKDVHAVVSGNGTHAQKIAHKKLHAKHGNFKHIPEHEQHAHILALATDIQSAATQSAEVSKWSKAALAGKAPTKANWAAFNALPPEKQSALTEKVKQAVGVDHLVNPQAVPEPAGGADQVREAKVEPKAVEAPAAAKGDAETKKKVDDIIAGIKGNPMFPLSKNPSVKDKIGALDADGKKALVVELSKEYPNFSSVKSEPIDVPDFSNYDEAVAWNKARAKAKGVTVSNYQTSHEYHILVHPKMVAAYQGVKAAHDAQQAEHGKKLQQAMDAAGLKVGDKVSAFAQSMFGFGGIKHTGTVVMKNGIPHVKADYKIDVNVGGKLKALKYVQWGPSWKKDGQASASDPQGDKQAAAESDAIPKTASQAPAPKDPNHDAAQAKLDELLSGAGAHYAVKAAKKLAQGDAWGKAEPVEKLKHVLSLGKEMQSAATASADVTKYKKSVADGKVPAKAQIKAFLALPKDKQSKVLEGLLSAHGFKHVSDLHNEAIKKHGVTQQGVLDEAAAKKPDDVDLDAALSGPTPEPQKDEPPAGEWSPDTFAHTKTGDTVHVVKIPKKLPDDEYKAAAAKAKAGGGHYSSFKKDGAVPGFHFKTEEQAKAFADAMNGEDGPKDGDTKQGADGTLVFKDGRWHKQGETVQAEPKDLPQTVDGWKQAMLSNQVPTQEQHAAYMALPASDKWAAEDEVESAIGAFAVNAILKKLEDRQIAGKKAQQEPKDMPQDLAGWRQAMLSGQVPTPRQTKSYLSGKLDETDKALNDVTAKIGYPAVKKLMGGETPEPQDAPDATETWAFDPGTQKGSNAGGLYTDTTGQKWYVKIPKSEDHAKNELLAAKLYEAAGVAVPELKLVESGGKAAIASKWVDGMSKVGADIKHADGALEGFAVDAWLANYDSVGTGYDNLLKDADGKAVRIDVGGALLYRAQGLPKTNFDASVVELQGMLDPNVNHYASQVFGGITPAQIKAGSAKVAAVTPETIKDLVEQYGPGLPYEKAALADLIIARRETVLATHPPVKAKAKKVPKAKPDPTKLKVDASKLPPLHDFQNWSGPGHGLSSKAHINDANLKAEQDLLDFAAKGNLVALKDYHFEALDKDTGASLGMKPIRDHPSTHVQLYHSDLVMYLEQIANPPAPPKKFKAATLNAIKAKPLGATNQTVQPSEQLGQWVALGKLASHSKYIPAGEVHVTSSAKAAAKSAWSSLSSLTKRFISHVQSSGTYNDLFRNGKQKDHDGYSTAAIAQSVYKEASTKPEGTLIYRWQNMPDSMVKQLLATPPGTVFQNAGSMCTSMHPTATQHFGNHRLKIRYADGAKAVDSFSSGGFSSEQEITTLMGQRFVILKVEKSSNIANTGKAGLDIDLLMLPPDDSYIADLAEQVKVTPHLTKSLNVLEEAA